MKTNLRLLPDFIVIGAQKAGTSSIYATLKNHPAISMANRTEVPFFSSSRNFAKGLSYYSSFFSPSSPSQICGAVNPADMADPIAARRIKQTIPDVKIIVSLRDPVDRAFSAWLMQISKGSERGRFAQAVQRNPIYLHHSYYFRNLKPFFDHFPRENILVLFFEDLKNDTGAFYESIYTFLGVDPRATQESIRVNDGGVPRSRVVTRVLNLCFKMMKRVQKSVFAPVVAVPFIYEICRRARNRVAEWNRNPMARNDQLPDPEGICFLEEKLEEDIKALEILVKRNLSSWRSHPEKVSAN